MQPIYSFNVKEIVKVIATGDYTEIKTRFMKNNKEYYTDKYDREFAQDDLTALWGSNRR